MNPCDDIRGLRWPYLDGELDAVRSERVEAHLAACPACAARYAAGRSFLRAVGEKGRERAPAGLRSRVEAALAEEAAAGAGAPPPVARRRIAWAWVAVPLAASIALLVVSGPWRGDPPGALSAGFAADHAAHAATAPGPPPGPGDPAPLVHAAAVGLARCGVDGRPYLHYVYRQDGATISVFVPEAGAPMPPPGQSLAIGSTRVLTVEGGDAALVAERLTETQLAAFWRGA